MLRWSSNRFLRRSRNRAKVQSGDLLEYAGASPGSQRLWIIADSGDRSDSIGRSAQPGAALALSESCPVLQRSAARSDPPVPVDRMGVLTARHRLANHQALIRVMPRCTSSMDSNATVFESARKLGPVHLTGHRASTRHPAVGRPNEFKSRIVPLLRWITFCLISLCHSHITKSTSVIPGFKTKFDG